MSQSNNLYRLFFKKLTNIEGRSISSSNLKVRSFTVNRDLLTKTTSTFQTLEVPSAVENGDIVGMYDAYGTIAFIGTVNYIEDDTIQANQIYGLFDDMWLWNNPKQRTLEDTIKTIIQNDYQNSNDTLLNSIFDCFDVSTVTSTVQTLQSQEAKYTVNFSNFLYDLYEKYSIMLDINIGFEEGRPTINIGIPNYSKLKIGNNANIFRNFDILTNSFETNKLVVYGEENEEYRGTWYATTSGITDNPSALNRIQKIKTNIVFSDDDINIIKASNLRNTIYNHEITCEMVLGNKLLSFEDVNLGQEADIYHNGDFYNSILTGYSATMTNGVDNGIVKLKFGLVRDTLTSKLFKRLANRYAS